MLHCNHNGNLQDTTDVNLRIFLQGPVVTDNSNFIVDCLFDKVEFDFDVISHFESDFKLSAF